MKNKKKYFFYPKDSREYDKWYTTNPELIKGFKKYKRVMAVCTTFAILTVGCVIAAIILGALNQIVGVFFLPAFVIFIFVAFAIGDKGEDIFLFYEAEYHKTNEFKKLKRKYDKEEAAKIDAIRYKKAKELVEAYDIIDDKAKTQEERIQLLKKYMRD